MRHGGANAISPATAIRSSRRSEGRSAELLGVKPERMLLRRVLALRQTSFDRLSGKLISKAGLVPDYISHAFHLSQAILPRALFGLVHCFVDLIKTGDCKQELVQLIHLYRSGEHLVQ